jgi:hypothetical protein
MRGAAGNLRSSQASESWGRHTVKRRIGGDRRARGRFEIVGTLSGTLETTQRLGLRNVGPGGALIESKVPLPIGSRLTGKLSLEGQTREVRAEVRHAAGPTGRGGERYLVGVEWVDMTPIDDLLREPARPGRESQAPVPERRRAGRMTTREGAEIYRPAWTTIELVDISTIGVMFVAPQEMARGEKGQLRLRLGDKDFVSEIEVSRVDRHPSASRGFRIGATFTVLDDIHRATLEEFIGTARH